jgi:hypothetical protein
VIHDFVMAGSNEQHIYVKCCFKLRKTALEVHEMLKTAFGNSGMGKTHTFELFFSIQM